MYVYNCEILFNYIIIDERFLKIHPPSPKKKKMDTIHLKSITLKIGADLYGDKEGGEGGRGLIPH